MAISAQGPSMAIHLRLGGEHQVVAPVQAFGAHHIRGPADVRARFIQGNLCYIGLAQPHH
jgi:hypothetical protein